VEIAGLLWLEEVIEKLERKHGVKPVEVREVFAQRPHIRFVERGHRRGENVYAALGKTDSGRFLIIFFVHKTDQRALILSARTMTDAERRRYEQET